MGKFLDLPIINKIFNDKSRLWLVFLILLPWLINTVRTPNNDFGLISKIVQDWLSGRTALYASGSAYFSYTPWSLFFYIPLSYIPHPFGQLFFNLISITLLIWSTWYLTKPIYWSVLAISLTTIYTGMLIMQGQWDAFVLASLTLGWIGLQRKNPWLIGISLVGMTTKYTNVVIPILLLLIFLRKWPIKKLIQAAIIPLGVFATSFLLVGWDWPLRYYRLLKLEMEFYQKYEFTTAFSKTIYPVSYRYILPPYGYVILAILGIIAIYLLYRLMKREANIDSFNLGLALNLLISPYFTFHHIIYLAPLQAQLLNNRKVWGAILYGVAFIDLLLLWLGVGIIIYPLVALLMIIFIHILEIRKRAGGFSDEAINPTG